MAPADAGPVAAGSSPSSTSRTDEGRPGPRGKRKARPRKLVTAVAPDGYLSIKSIPWSRVYVRGRLLGITPLAQVRLAPGRYELLLKNPEHKDKRVRVTISADETTKVAVTLE